MRRLLITGAAGFIGYHLARHFAEKGDAVWGLDNFNPYYDPSLKRKRASMLADVGVDVLEGDICDRELLEKLLSTHKITDCVHMAAQAGVRYSTHHPQAYVKANLEGFVSVLEACRSHPDITLTYASSSSIYGAEGGATSAVDSPADKPISLYAATKRSNELMAHAYHHLYGLRSTGLRYFTVYGPWGRPDMAYYTFAKAILAGETLSLSNAGNVHRSFTYIDDIVAGTAAAIEHPTTCSLFNLGHPTSEPLGKLVSLLEQHLGLPARTVSQPLPAGDTLVTAADISATTAALGFQPTVDLAEGISRFATWYRSTYKT